MVQRRHTEELLKSDASSRTRATPQVSTFDKINQFYNIMTVTLSGPLPQYTEFEQVTSGVQSRNST